MGRGRERAKQQKPAGRSTTLGPRRPSVDWGPAEDWGPDESGFGDDAGSAGVREPRRPLPSGPLSAAGTLPEPEPPTYLKLADARH
jgi:hypothetical protein